MVPQPDYHDWPTKAEAAEAIGISVRQLERMLEAGKVQTAFRPVPHRRAACVCDPVAVSRIAGERRAVRPTVETGLAPSIYDPASAGAALDRSVWEFYERNKAGRVDLSQKLYLTIDEAVEYSGLPASYLHKLIREGRLEAVRADRWLRIGRKSLERLAL